MIITTIGAVSPAWGQIPTQPALKLPFLPDLSNNVYRVGDIEYTNVYLDGLPLFKVAAKASAAPEGVSPAKLRAQTIENILDGVVEHLVRANITSEDISLTIGKLNNQTVISIAAIDDNLQRIIMSVTRLDAQISQNPVNELAEKWSRILRLRLVKARETRQPEARWQQTKRATRTSLLVIFVSTVIFWGQKILSSQYRDRQERLVECYHQLANDTDTPTASGAKVFLKMKLVSFRRRWFNGKQQQNLNRLLSNLLQWMQGAIWLVGLVWILYQFPELRWLSLLLTSFPIGILTIWLVVGLARNIAHSFIDAQAQAWTDKASKQEKFTRATLRAPTLAEVFKKLADALAILIGISWFFSWQQISFTSILTGAGLLGIAISLIFQNLIKDWINGIFIVLEDQYAIGDVIDLGNTSGLVEDMDLRTTRLRGEGGKLSTVPHSQVSTVHNLTKDWSQAEVGVTLSKSTDVVWAIESIQDVLERMRQNLHWQKDIFKASSSIWISEVDSACIYFRIKLKTKRARQWDIERELLYRLKQVFDDRETTISISRSPI